MASSSNAMASSSNAMASSSTMASSSNTMASSSTSGSSKVVKIKSSDDETFEVEKAAVVKSETGKKLLEDVGVADATIPLPNVDATTLVKVMEWCKKHIDYKLIEEEVKTWEAKYVDMDESSLYDLISAANFLNIEELLDQLAQRVADMIKGKSPAEIRATFNIVNDFTPEEEAKIIKDNEWAFQ